MAKLEHRVAHELPGSVAEQREADGRRVDDGAVGAVARQHIRRVVGEKPVPRLALAQRDLGALSLRDVARHGEERRHPAVALFDVHVLPDPELATIDADGGKFPVRDWNPLGHLPLVESDALLMVVAPNELEVHATDDTAVIRTAAKE